MAKKPTHEDLEQRVKALEKESFKFKQVKEALWDTYELLEKIFSTTHLLIAYMDKDFNFIRVNLAYAAADDREPDFFVGKNHFDLYPHKDNESIFRRVVETGEPYTAYAKPFEYVEHPELGETYWDWTLHPVKDASGKVEGLVLCLVNVTERIKAEEALRESQKLYKALWDDAPVAYHTLDTRGVITQVNQTEIDMLGYTRGEMVGKPIFEFILPEQRKEAEERFRLKLAGEPIPRHDNRIYVKKDGSKIYVSIDDALEYGSDGKVLGVRTTMVDVTERKRDEEALQRSEAELRRLSFRLLNAQENERKRISRELHDGIGQFLSAIKFGLENALNQTRQGATKAGVESLEAIIPIIQQSIEEVRRISMNLRPSTLDDLGIIATISWLCREFETVYSAFCIEKQIDIQENDVPDSLKIAIYRILQEALNNIAKHAQADLVRLSLKRTDGKIELAVEDNGQGFDVEHMRSVENFRGGSGITSMRERTELLGGSFSIASHKGAGTIVRASWPIKE
ncbi:MAG: PAS domain S-box protein [Deltaproteobacteria bacterium]|nr:PAS domain S-box protein [Deltaproteobacteria bacterium]MBW2019105.1 PAS domain S-box protein [Deltaproteobacteria bacterium]MBW2073504.1 PAS domain S-box protein [Deltaproteobacteria bacterium]